MQSVCFDSAKPLEHMRICSEQEPIDTENYFVSLKRSKSDVDDDCGNVWLAEDEEPVNLNWLILFLISLSFISVLVDEVLMEMYVGQQAEGSTRNETMFGRIFHMFFREDMDSFMIHTDIFSLIQNAPLVLFGCLSFIWIFVAFFGWRFTTQKPISRLQKKITALSSR
eukprot:snap_masked-scaffold_17-processed-gene-6.60-mRNA-1 protein AED:1.00 eAED:1.00 QI:0/-1/0/0/-1/1/1/0/167